MRVASPCARAASGASGAFIASPSSASKQVLRLKHRGRDVFLIGTMHYNPASIRLCEETVSTLRRASRLGAVVLETCPKRWEKTLTYQPAGSVMRSVLDNEFQSAAEAAGDDAEIVLGDQEIAALGENLGTAGQGDRVRFVVSAARVYGWVEELRGRRSRGGGARKSTAATRASTRWICSATASCCSTPRCL